MLELLEMFGWLCAIIGALIAIPTIAIIILCKIVNAIFGTSFGEYSGGGSSSASSSSTSDFHREYFVRQMGEPAQLYTSTDTAFGTVVNKYGAPPEEAIIINNFKK